MEKEIELSIVIPAYKEEERIHKVLDAIVAYQKKKDFLIETIVVVDGSPDKTAEAARAFSKQIENLRVIDRKENKGKGATVKEGVLAALGKYVLFADADNSTPVEQADKLLPHIEKYEVVIGSRYVDGGKLALPQSIARRVGSRVLNIIIQILAVSGIRDTQCGFKMFQRDAAVEIFKRTTLNNFSFDVEVLAIAKKLGYKIKEAGITWYDDPHSTVSPIGDGVRMIEDSWYIRRGIISGRYS